MDLKKNADSKRSDMYHVPFSFLSVEPDFNCRKTFDITDLIESIRENGVIEPLKVKDVGDTLVITNGERRYRALKALVDSGEDVGLIPCRVQPKNYSDDQRLADQIRSNDGVPFTMLEQGLVMKRLRDKFGMKNIEISKRVGKDEAHVSSCLTLADSDIRIQHFILDGKISETAALLLIRKEPDADKQVAAIEKTLETSSKATGAAIKENLEESGAVKLSRKKVLAEFFQDHYAEYQRKPQFLAIDSIGRYLEGKLDFDDLLHELGL